MLENVVSRRVTLQAYNFEVFGDQIAFNVSTDVNGNNTWNGLSKPGIIAFGAWENEWSLVVALRSIYYNGGLQVDGLTATLQYTGIRLVDPVYTHNGPFSTWPPYQSAGSTMYVDWGDGSSETLDLSVNTLDPAPQHVYAEAGTYTVTSTANLTDVPFGEAPSVSLDIEVVEP